MLWLRKFKLYRKYSNKTWHKNAVSCSVLNDYINPPSERSTKLWSNDYYPYDSWNGFCRYVTVESEMWATDKNGKRRYITLKYKISPITMWESKQLDVKKKFRRKWSFKDANYQELAKVRPWDNDPSWPL